MRPRYVVRELHGYAMPARPSSRGGGAGRGGMTVTVHDMAWCGRVVGLWRTERPLKGAPNVQSRAHRFALARARAHALAARLNANEREDTWTT